MQTQNLDQVLTVLQAKGDEVRRLQLYYKPANQAPFLVGTWTPPDPPANGSAREDDNDDDPFEDLEEGSRDDKPAPSPAWIKAAYAWVRQKAISHARTAGAKVAKYQVKVFGDKATYLVSCQFQVIIEGNEDPLSSALHGPLRAAYEASIPPDLAWEAGALPRPGDAHSPVTMEALSLVGLVGSWNRHVLTPAHAALTSQVLRHTERQAGTIDQQSRMILMQEANIRDLNSEIAALKASLEANHDDKRARSETVRSVVHRAGDTVTAYLMLRSGVPPELQRIIQVVMRDARLMRLLSHPALHELLEDPEEASVIADIFESLIQAQENAKAAAKSTSDASPASQPEQPPAPSPTMDAPFPNEDAK